MIQVQNGTVSVGYTISSTYHRLINWIPVQSPNVANILNSGRNSSVSGMRYVRNTPVASVADPQNRMRDSANAAGTLISMVMVTTKIETSAEFQKNRRNWFEESSST